MSTASPCANLATVLVDTLSSLSAMTAAITEIRLSGKAVGCVSEVTSLQDELSTAKLRIMSTLANHRDPPARSDEGLQARVRVVEALIKASNSRGGAELAAEADLIVTALETKSAYGPGASVVSVGSERPAPVGENPYAAGVAPGNDNPQPAPVASAAFGPGGGKRGH